MAVAVTVAYGAANVLAQVVWRAALFVRQFAMLVAVLVVQSVSNRRKAFFFLCLTTAKTFFSLSVLDE